ncbi:hypothetical protein ATKI12_1248 [Kitasatospora sp. Ki12]
MWLPVRCADRPASGTSPKFFDIAEKLQKACGYMLRRLQVLQGESNCN